uniref:Putative secreted protein n=1 Tax=Anopheles darlingi TaxID=43151 RepID=A0A2M4DNI8_ANODA
MSFRCFPNYFGPILARSLALALSPVSLGDKMSEIRVLVVVGSDATTTTATKPFEWTSGASAFATATDCQHSSSSSSSGRFWRELIFHLATLIPEQPPRRMRPRVGDYFSYPTFCICLSHPQRPHNRCSVNLSSPEATMRAMLYEAPTIEVDDDVVVSHLLGLHLGLASAHPLSVMVSSEVEEEGKGKKTYPHT